MPLQLSGTGNITRMMRCHPIISRVAFFVRRKICRHKAGRKEQDNFIFGKNCRNHLSMIKKTSKNKIYFVKITLLSHLFCV